MPNRVESQRYPREGRGSTASPRSRGLLFSVYITLQPPPAGHLSPMVRPCLSHRCHHGFGIRIVISDRASPYGPLPCHSKFVIRIADSREQPRSSSHIVLDDMAAVNMLDTCRLIKAGDVSSRLRRAAGIPQHAHGFNDFVGETSKATSTKFHAN